MHCFDHGHVSQELLWKSGSEPLSLFWFFCAFDSHAFCIDLFPSTAKLSANLSQRATCRFVLANWARRVFFLDSLLSMIRLLLLTSLHSWGWPPLWLKKTSLQNCENKIKIIKKKSDFIWSFSLPISPLGIPVKFGDFYKLLFPTAFVFMFVFPHCIFY